MKLTLLGAAGGEVTGSAYVLQTAAATVMIACGLFQGSQKLKKSNRLPTTAAMQQLKAVVLTHAHLDHTNITRHGEDHPRILNWRWGGGSGPTRRRSSTEGDNL